MNLIKGLLFAVVAIGCLAACEKNEDSDRTIENKFGEPLPLKIGESVEVEGAAFVVAFDEIIEDSRCPTGVECFWEGQAKIQLLINDAQSVEVIKRAGKEEMAKDTLDGFVYTLLDVSPYPDAKTVLPIPTESYTIDIQVDAL